MKNPTQIAVDQTNFHLFGSSKYRTLRREGKNENDPEVQTFLKAAKMHSRSDEALKNTPNLKIGDALWFDGDLTHRGVTGGKVGVFMQWYSERLV